MYHHPTMYTGADVLTRRERDREAERNLIADLESIHTDLEAAATTAGYVDEDLADEIKAIREKVAVRLGQYP